MVEAFQNFLISFYSQLIYMAITATVFGCFILIIRKLTYKKLEPRCNYCIWGLFVFMLLFPVTLPSKINVYNYLDNFLKIERWQYENDTFTLAGEESNFYHEVKKKIYHNIRKNRKYVVRVVVDICFAISAIRFGRKIYSAIFWYHKVGCEEMENKRLKEIVEECRKCLKIKRTVKIIKQNSLKTPAVIGIFRPKILFTDELLLFSDVKIKNMLMHEMAHFKRKDTIVNFLIPLIRAVYWFDPVLKIMFFRMKNDIEMATDALALSKLGAGMEEEYCKTMFAVAYLETREIHEVLAMATTKTKLMDRVDAIYAK